MEDRLSALPDELICRLLSFLPPKTFVQTSVLAKPWRFLWSRVPRFIATVKITDQVQSMSQSLNLFHISPGSDSSNHEFESWIATVFASNVRNLVISLDYQRTLPSFFFNCETLLYLSIYDCDGDIPDATVYFPSLKMLQLVNVNYDSSNSLIRLLSGCPVLEELMIERMQGPCIPYLYSDTLTTLVIDIEEFVNVSLIISSLRYLRFRAHRSVIDCVCDCALALLIEADIDLVNVDEYCCPNSVINFVCELRSVKCLALSTRPINIPTSCFSTLDHFKFHNLTELSLRADWRFITRFLENADNIRVLTIRSMDDSDDPDYCPGQYWTAPKQVPVCLLSHLESVNLVDFGWCREHEFDMAKYILRNAKVLKMMEIKCSPNYQLDSNAKSEAIKKFARFEIESRTCELMLTFDAY